MQQEILTVLPSGFYSTVSTSQYSGDSGLQSWLVSHPPSPIPKFWSEVLACETGVIVGDQPHAYQEIVGPITVHETTTAIISSALAIQPIQPAATPPLPTPKATSQPNTPDQTIPPIHGNTVAEVPPEGPPKPDQKPASKFENIGLEKPQPSAPKPPPSLSEHSPASQSGLALLSISQDARGIFFIGSKPLLPGSSMFESDTTVSLDQTGSTLFLNGFPYKPPATASPGMVYPSYALGPDSKDSSSPDILYFVIGSSTSTYNSESVDKLRSQTLSRGNAITVSGTTISLDSSGLSVFINNTPAPIRTLRNTQRPQFVFGGSTYFQTRLLPSK